MARRLQVGWEIPQIDIECTSSIRSIGTATIDTTITDRSAGSLKIVVSGGIGVNRDELYIEDTDVNQNIHLKFNFYCSSHTAPVAVSEVFRLMNAADQASCSVAWDSTGDSLCMLSSLGLKVGSSSSITLNEWHKIGLSFIFDGTTGSTCTFYIDDTEISSGVVGNIAAGNHATKLFIGAVDSQTATMYFDNLIANDESVIALNLPEEDEMPSDQVIRHKYPLGDAGSDWNGSPQTRWKKDDGSAGDANNYQLVDENPPDDATTYLLHNINDSTFDWVTTRTNETEGIPENIYVAVVFTAGRIGATSNATSERYGQFNFRESGSIHAHGMITDWSIDGWATMDDIQIKIGRPFTGTNNWKFYRIPEVDVDTARRWDYDTLNTLEIGVSTDCNNQVRCSTLWASISYLPLALNDPTGSLLGFTGTQ